MKKTKEIVVILPDIRSTHNVGAILRTCDGAGVSKVYFTGYTPTPVDKFGKKRQDVTKASLGAEDSVRWEYCKTLPPLIKRLKKDGYEVVALEQDKNSIDYKKYKVKGRTALILGNEVTGITKNILKLCDKIIEIKMHGEKESLNVSVATGVALFSLR